MIDFVKKIDDDTRYNAKYKIKVYEMREICSENFY